jgi:hypothetical protein
MQIFGYIQSLSDKTPVQYATVQVFNGSSLVRSTVARADGYFTIEAEAGTTIVFSQAEYVSKTLTTKYLDDFISVFDYALVGMQPKNNTLPDVVITSGKKKNNLWIAAALAALAFTMNKKKGSISGIKQPINPNTAIMIGGGLIGLTVLKKVLDQLGITRGPGGQATATEQQNPYSEWKPQFYKAAPAGALLLHTDTAQAMSKIIFNAFTVFTDDFNAIFGVISQLKTKSQLSFLSEVFYNKYSSDLLTFLTNGGGILPWDGLSDAQMLKLTNYVNSLPNYNA